MKPGDKVRCKTTLRGHLGGTISEGDVCEVVYAYRSQLNSSATCLDLKLPDGSLSDQGWYSHWFEPVSAPPGQAPGADAPPQGVLTSTDPDRYHEHVQPPASFKNNEQDAQPSREAWELARQHYDRITRAYQYQEGYQSAWESLAAALQKLMDERDLVRQELGKLAEHWQERAEAAEKALENAEVDKTNARWQEAEKRAEAAEKRAKLVESMNRSQSRLAEDAIDRAEAAEAKATLNIQSRAEAIERAEAAEKDATNQSIRLARALARAEAAEAIVKSQQAAMRKGAEIARELTERAEAAEKARARLAQDLSNERLETARVASRLSIQCNMTENGAQICKKVAAERDAALARAEAAEEVSKQLASHAAGAERERDAAQVRLARMQERAEAAENDRDRYKKLADEWGNNYAHFAALSSLRLRWSGRWKKLAKTSRMDRADATKLLRIQNDACRRANARAEAAEAKIVRESAWTTRMSMERDAALASKAQLVREVRQANMNGMGRPIFPQIEDILDRHSGPDAEHPDTVRLRELVREVRKWSEGCYPILNVLRAKLDRYEAKS